MSRRLIHRLISCSARTSPWRHTNTSSNSQKSLLKNVSGAAWKKKKTTKVLGSLLGDCSPVSFWLMLLNEHQSKGSTGRQSKTSRLKALYSGIWISDSGPWFRTWVRLGSPQDSGWVVGQYWQCCPEAPPAALAACRGSSWTFSSIWMDFPWCGPVDSGARPRSDMLREDSQWVQTFTTIVLTLLTSSLWSWWIIPLCWLSHEFRL